MKKLALFFISILICLLLAACGDEQTSSQQDVAELPEKDKDIREYNLEIEKDQAGRRAPCDTLELEDYIIKNYPEGSYLIEFDKTLTKSVFKRAVVYHRAPQGMLIFAVIAKSKPGERLVEKKNVVGFESSFINLDSTKLGTAFFYLTMFECRNSELVPMWEAEVPIHGGFNYISMNLWAPKRIPYITLNFEDGIISGHRNYNYFFVDGFFERPHLLETYEGLVHKRIMANINNDNYPDYYEFRFYEQRLAIRDSIPFSWDEQQREYRSPVNRRWRRKY